MRFLLAFFFFSSLVFAQSYHFTELRYSDAINHYMQLEGTIDFYKDSLDIKYPKIAKELDYKDGELLYYEKSKEVALSELQKFKMIRYFEILILLHNGDVHELNEMFTIEHTSDGERLLPLGRLKSYLKYILLRKEKNSLKYIKLFLQNSDTISITIHDKIS